MKKAVLPILFPFNLFFRFSFLLCLSSSWLQAQFEVPEGITFRQADIMSEGTRIAAEVFTPKEPADRIWDATSLSNVSGDGEMNRAVPLTIS